jgi:hypothetical protein
MDRSSVPRPRKVFRFEEHQRAEIDLMKRDIADKDAQIVHLTHQTERLDTISGLFYDLIIDLEHCTGESFLAADQRPPNELPSAHGLFALLRRGLTTLVTLHTDMAKRFEDDFAQRAEAALRRVQSDESEISALRSDRLRIADSIVRLNRLASLERSERQSIEAMADSLSQRMAQSAKQRDAETGVVREQIAAVAESIASLEGAVRAKRERAAKAEEDAGTDSPKRVTDALKEDRELDLRIHELEKLVERERAERALSEAELVHVQGEIERAQEMIDTFKRNLTKEKQMSADAVNAKLKGFIEQQREEYRRAIANQRKRNTELEKQRTELTEEEKMLNGVLVSLEKQLQAQMQKLPSLAQLQQRGAIAGAQKRSMPAKAMRPIDDAEMRGIRKAIVLLKARKGVSKSVLVGSRFH